MTGAADRWQDLDRLLDRVLDGLHTDEDARELNQVLRTDPEACRRYVSYLQLHGRLCWGQRGLATSQPQGPGNSQPRGLGTSVPSEIGCGEGSGIGVQEVIKSQIPDQQILDPSSFSIHPSDVGAAVELPHQLGDAADSEPLIPPIIIDTSAAVPAPFSYLKSSLGAWLISYGVATVLVARPSWAPGCIRCRWMALARGPFPSPSSSRRHCRPAIAGG